MKIIKYGVVGIIFVGIGISLAGMYKFNYLSGKDGADVDKDKIITMHTIKSFEECTDILGAQINVKKLPHICITPNGEKFEGVLANGLGEQDLIFNGHGLNIEDLNDLKERQLYAGKMIYLTAMNGSALHGKLDTEMFGCDDKIIGVEIYGETTPEQALKAMFDNNDYDVDSGMYNVFDSSQLIIDSLDVNGGLATVKLSGTLVTSGMCDDPRVGEQINQTLVQFDTITESIVFINGESIGSFLSEKE